MKIWTILVGVELQPDQHPKTSVVHKVGGYDSGSDISRGLYTLADIRDGGQYALTGKPVEHSVTTGTVTITKENLQDPEIQKALYTLKRD
jgi:hypothetical protein